MKHSWRFHVLLTSVALIVIGGTSLYGSATGGAWFRPWSTPNVLLPFYVAAAGPETIEVRWQYYAGGGELDILDACHDLVFKTVVGNYSYYAQSFTFAFAHPGTYYALLTGNPSSTARYRISISAAKFVIPGLTDFDSDSELASTYYFYVPPTAETFRFRLWVPDTGESSTATVIDSQNATRLTQSLNGSDGTWVISTDPATRGAFWKVAIVQHTGDVRFAVMDIPNWFSDSPASWFQPAPSCPPATLPSSGGSSVHSDFHGDGSSDIVWRTNDNAWQLWKIVNFALVNGNSFGFADLNVWTIASLADFDGDGKSDVLLRNRITGENYIYLMDGATITTPGAVNTIPDPLWKIVAAADFDGDGRRTSSGAMESPASITCIAWTDSPS